MMQISKAGISDKRGFSLIEVAMVLFVFSILMAAAAPRLASYLSSSKLEKNVSRLATYLEHVRDEAIYKRQVLLLKCLIEEGSFSVYSAAGEKDRSVLMKPLDFPEEIRIVDIHITGKEKKSVGETLLSFFPGGMADGALFHIKDNADHEITLELSPLSRTVEIHEGYLETS